MTVIVATICLIIGLGAGIFALRPKALRSLDVAVDQSASHENFTLAHSLLIIGPRMNEKFCAAQRKEFRRILQPLLSAQYKIIEIYGDNAPTENGQPYEWLDSHLLKRTLNAEEGFHMIHVNGEGRTGFHSGRPVVAEALLHILDLWDHISEENENDLTDVEEDAPEMPVAVINSDEKKRIEPPVTRTAHLTVVPSVPEEEKPADAAPQMEQDKKAPTHISQAVRSRLTLR
jgi:hypothetical protein